MKKNQIMRCLAAAAAAVLITTSTVPAYAMEYADAEVMDELSEFSEEDVYEASSDENHEVDSVLPADEPGDEELQENELEEEAYETDADETDDEFFAEEADDTAEEDTAEEDESEDEFMGDPVAKVLIGVTETPFEKFDDAAAYWNTMGAGAKLILLRDVETEGTVAVSGGSSSLPMILDLNDHGILYKGNDYISVITVNSDAFLEIRDGSESKHDRYFSKDESGRATGFYGEDAEGRIKVTGGYIAGGTGTGGQYVSEGGGIKNSGTLTISGGTVCGNVSVTGGSGVWNEGTFTLNNGKICNNCSELGRGGGIRCDSGTVTISGGEISYNSAVDGGGVYLYGGTGFTMSDGMITHNATNSTKEHEGMGGGIFSQISNMEITGGEISDNSAQSGGGVWTGHLDFKAGKISGNSATIEGGGIAVAGTTQISGNTDISSNTATAEGGGIYVLAGGTLTINSENPRIIYNKSINGGGIANYGTLIMNGGNIFWNDHDYILEEKGGGIYNKNVATLNDGRVDSNGSQYGGGIYNSGTLNLAGAVIVNNSVTGEGAGLYSDAGTVTMTGGMIKKNDAIGNGGGVYNTNATFILVDGVITDNRTLENNGGGIFNAGALEMRGGTVSNNNAFNGGGGVVNGNLCTFTMDSGKITNNKADLGGGVFNLGTFTLNGGKVTGNTSTDTGSAIFNSGDSFTMSSGEISGDASAPDNTMYIEDGVALSFKGAIYASEDTEGKNLKHVSSSEAKENINTYGYLLIAPIDVASVASKSGQVKKYADLSDAVTAWNDAGAGAKLTVLDDAVTETVINVNAGTETDPMVLDLNGHGILLSGESSSKNILMINTGASLELRDTGAKTERFIKLDANGKGTDVTDSVPEGEHIKVTGGYLTGLGNGYGAVKAAASSSFRMNGGTIAGNTATSGFGGGVTNDGKFVMNGGSIFGNTGITAGGVLNAQAGTFDMKGGSISDNSGNHGGVYNNGILNLTDGNISDNTAKTGGGVFVDTAGVFTVSGGRISGNKATEKGGGVYTNNGSFTMKGGELSGNDSPDGKAFFNNNGSIAFYGEVYASQNADGAGGKQYSAAEAPDLVKDMGYVSVLKLYAEKVDDMTYTGSAIVPAFKVYLGATLLKEKTDYSVTLKKNTDVGTAEFTISGKGNFSEKINGTFNIIKKNIGDADVTAAEIAPKVAGKTAYKPVPSLTYNKKKLATKEFTVKYYSDEACTQEVDAPIAAGHYWAKAIAAEKNFTGTKTVPFMITASNQIMVSKLTVAKIPDRQYASGEKIKPEISVKNGTKPVEPSYYDVSYSSNTEIGTAYVTITGKEDKGYIGSKTVTFKIVGNALSKAKVVDTGFVKTYEYSGTAKKNTITLLEKKNAQDPGTALSGMDKELYDGLPYGSAAKLAVDYVISYENNINAGTATMLMTGVNAWTGTVKKTFKIDKFNIKNNPGGKFAVTLAKSSYPFAKAGVKPKAEVKFNGKLLSEGTDYKVAYSNNTAVGGTKPPTVKVTGKGNFTGANESTTFSIEKADLAAAGITVTAKDVVWANKKGNYKTTVTVSDSDGKKLTANTDYTLTFSEHEDGSDPFGKDHKVDPGTTVYVIVTATDNAKSCYKNKAVGTYRVCSKDIGKLTAKVADQEYTGKPVTITKEDISWKSAGKPFDLPDECFEIVPGSYEKNISKGTASVTVKGKGEYGGTKKLTFAIKAKAFKLLD
ncbi:MAG: hypothetical protein K6F73_07795 [Lachnospiraceae bacterium]|nr:hypothetical protein [Lachnospiraceae bacterium]